MAIFCKKWVKCSRLLGVDIAIKLSWTSHVSDLKKNFANKLSLIKKCRFLPKHVLLNLYFKVIIPSVTYGIAVWGGGVISRQDNFDALERLHCRAGRVIFNFPKDMPSAKVLARAKWDALRTRYKLSILKLISKMFHNVSPSYRSIHISKFQPSYDLRRSHLIAIPSFRTNIMKSSIAYRGAILWNHLPGKCRKAVSLGSFIKVFMSRMQLKTLILVTCTVRRFRCF